MPPRNSDGAYPLSEFLFQPVLDDVKLRGSLSFLVLFCTIPRALPHKTFIELWWTLIYQLI